MRPLVYVAQERYTCLTDVKGLFTHSSPASAIESTCDSRATRNLFRLCSFV